MVLVIVNCIVVSSIPSPVLNVAFDASANVRVPFATLKNTSYVIALFDESSSIEVKVLNPLISVFVGQVICAGV